MSIELQYLVQEIAFRAARRNVFVDVANYAIYIV